MFFIFLCSLPPSHPPNTPDHFHTFISILKKHLFHTPNISIHMKGHHDSNPPGFSWPPFSLIWLVSLRTGPSCVAQPLPLCLALESALFIGSTCSPLLLSVSVSGGTSTWTGLSCLALSVTRVGKVFLIILPNLVRKPASYRSKPCSSALFL